MKAPKKARNIRFTEDIWNEIDEMAELRGMSANAWLLNAARTQLNREARYARAEKARQERREKEKATAGKCCIPCGCVPAAECRFPERHNTKANWVDAELCRE